VREAIAGFRERLLGEHLGVAPERIREALERHRSLRSAIEALGSDGRTLKMLAHEPEGPDVVMTLAALADPEAPVGIDALHAELAPRVRERSGVGLWLRMATAIAVILGLAAMWRYSPLAQWTTAERIIAWAEQFSAAPWAPLAVMAAYTPASIVMFPRSLVTLFAVVAFDAWLGFTFAMSGILIAALLTYLSGTYFDRATVRRLGGQKVDRIVRVLRGRGLVAMTALRLVPLAPFAVEGVIAGAIHIRLRDFMIGTFLGMLPGTLTATVFGDQFAAALHDPSAVNPWLIVGVTLALAAATLYVRHWLLTTEVSADAATRD